MRVQEAELLWGPALLQGKNPPCESQWWSCLGRIPGLSCAVSSQLIYSLVRSTCAPLQPFYSFFKSSKLPVECQRHVSIPISASAIRCATNLHISVAPQGCSQADSRVILVGVTFLPQGPEVQRLPLLYSSLKIKQQLEVLECVWRSWSKV